jgi:hypothetical protein
MPEQGADVVRERIVVRASSRRRVLEQLALRLPRAAQLVSRMVLQFSPRSWLRKMLVRYTFRLAVEASNRGDYEAAFALLPPDYEAIAPPELVDLGFEPVYRGREGRLRYQRQWMAELGEFQQETEELLDLGDRLLLLGRMKGIGASSGLGFDSEVAYLIEVASGRLVREQTFRSHEQALKAAGLREPA